MSEIQGHLEEIYHTEVSKELISTVTDGVIEEVTRWQNRALDEAYRGCSFNCVNQVVACLENVFPAEKRSVPNC